MGIVHDTVEVAQHRRTPDGAHRRVVIPDHFQPLFTKKPRAQVMLYRQTLLDLSPEAEGYVSEVSSRRRERLREEILATYALLVLHGGEALAAAMAQADARGIYGAEYLQVLLAVASADLVLPPLALDLPAQEQVDWELAQYEAFVTVSPGGAAW